MCDAAHARYVGGLVPDVEDKELRDKFYSFGEIASIKVVLMSLSHALLATGKVHFVAQGR